MMRCNVKLELTTLVHGSTNDNWGKGLHSTVVDTNYDNGSQRGRPDLFEW